MRRERNKEYTKERLIEAAMQLFMKKEYQKTTIEEIAKAAQVSKPTFFAYFRSKEEVLFEFDLQQLKTFQRYMDDQIMKNSDLVHDLKKAIVQMAANVHTTHIFTQNLMHLSTINDEYRRLLSETFSVFRSVIRKVIEYGQNESIITMDVLADDIAMDIQNIYVGTLTNWVFSNGNGSLEILMDQTLGNYLQGISCKLSSD